MQEECSKTKLFRAWYPGNVSKMREMQNMNQIIFVYLTASFLSVKSVVVVDVHETWLL